MSAYLTVHLVHKRLAVILTHMATSIPVFAFGLVFLSAGRTPHTVTVFLVFYTMSSLLLGLTIPIWQNFLVKIFSEHNVFRAISIMLICQTAAKLIGSIVIVKFVERFSFSPQYAGIVFISLGILFFFGTFFFLFVREVDTGYDSAGKNAHTIHTLAATVIGIFHNRNFMLYLLGMTESFTCITLISFYANYAVEYHSVPSPVAAGVFVAFIHAAGIAGFFLFGWFDLFKLKNKLVISRIFALGAIGCLLAANSLPWFLAASFFLGGSRAISNLCFSPAVKKLSGLHDATDYFAVSQLLILPLSFGIPFLCGVFLDAFSFMGLFSYQIMFGILGLLIIMSLVCISKIDFAG
jgi:hypothetical protein